MIEQPQDPLKRIMLERFGTQNPRETDPLWKEEPLNRMLLERFGIHDPLKMDPLWPKAHMRLVTDLECEELHPYRTVALHGTSLHALRKIIETAGLEPGRVEGAITEGCVYFEPFPDKIKSASQKTGFEEDERL